MSVVSAPIKSTPFENSRRATQTPTDECFELLCGFRQKTVQCERQLIVSRFMVVSLQKESCIVN